VEFNEEEEGEDEDAEDEEEVGVRGGPADEGGLVDGEVDEDEAGNA